MLSGHPEWICNCVFADEQHSKVSTRGVWLDGMLTKSWCSMTDADLKAVDCCAAYFGKETLDTAYLLRTYCVPRHVL
jgi:hypothetical protein